MPTLRLSFSAAALLALALASAPAEAQRPSTASPTTRATIAPTRPFANVVRRADLLSRRLSAGLDEARRFHHRQVARCLSDHLSQVHSLLRQLELRRESTAPAIEPRRLAHMTQVFRRRLGALDAGSRGCRGGAVTEGRATIVVTEIDPSVPREDPSRLPSDPWRASNPAVPPIPPPISPTI